MFDYPALYEGAGTLAEDAQALFLRLIVGEFALLVIAAILSLGLGQTAGYYAVSAAVLLLGLAVMATRYWLKPEQDWYKGRALAESIKTSAWRYCMRAEPFDDGGNSAASRSEFRDHLMAILEANRRIGHRIPPNSAANDQITSTMQTLRASSLQDRIDVYRSSRIIEQRNWYDDKSKTNRRASRKWLAIGVAAYAASICFALARIAYPEKEIWPIEPLIVVASSVIGWTQVKKWDLYT